MCDNVGIFDTFCACCLGQSSNPTRSKREPYDDETTPLLRECDLAQTVTQLENSINGESRTISVSSSTTSMGSSNSKLQLPPGDSDVEQITEVAKYIRKQNKMLTLYLVTGINFWLWKIYLFSCNL